MPPSPTRSRPSYRPLRGVALLLAGASCTGAEPAEPTTAQVTGTYALESVNGQALPAPIFGSSTTVYVLRSTRVLRSDGTCATAGTYRSTYLGRVDTNDYTVACTWTLTGTALTFSIAGQAPVSGLLDWETATVNRDGTAFTEATLPSSATAYYPRIWRKR